ncbi:DUF1450 domain-containing protein [Bacillus sp. CH30_1T]|uniref:YuzB family protein n=1 Tax=Bacillus sp. CH30_1T TaxID=2604836 RepID=UPI0011EEAF18|nr:YuzB family protein [Bacillus sp. CH30_1T]KAA0561150.1 DUF1450 domain-containing protein [Bacillus sp. CH30_1T]
MRKKDSITKSSEVIELKPIIEFCISNLASGAQKALEILERDPNLDVIEYGCLGYCGKCAQSFYALVNGEVVTGDTPEELVDHIYQFLEDNPMF